MQNISATWLYRLILIAGALQAREPSIKGALRKALENPWHARIISFLAIAALLEVLLLALSHSLPS